MSFSVLNLVLQNHTDWELTKQFVIEQLQVALLTDSQKAVLPLSVADGVVNNFDDVSYNKGGSIFRMVHYILGLENFQKGLTDYMSAQYVDFETTRRE
jgi:aminopeptidase N